MLGLEGGDEAADAGAVDQEVYWLVGEVGREGEDGLLVCEIQGVGMDVGTCGLDGRDVEGEDFRGGLSAVGLDEGGS